MACLRPFSGLFRSSVRRTPVLSPSGGSLLNPTTVFASKSGYSSRFDESSNVDDLFENWCLRYGKWYSSEEEKQYKRQLFDVSVANCLSIKERNPSYVPKYNGLMDRPSWDFDTGDACPKRNRHLGKMGGGGYKRDKTKRPRHKSRPAATELVDRQMKWKPVGAWGKQEDCILFHAARGTLTY